MSVSDWAAQFDIDTPVEEVMFLQSLLDTTDSCISAYQAHRQDSILLNA